MSKTIDNQQEKELVKKLQGLGLTDKEALVYMALLPKEDVGSSKLIQATGLHGQFVYSALAKLEALGLAKHVVQNGRKKFSANPPSRLLALVEEKRLSAQAVAKELQAHFARAHEQDFEVYQGDNAFLAHQLEMVEKAPEGSRLDVIASDTERYSNTYREYGLWDEYLKRWKEKNIHVRYLGTEAQRERLQWREKNEPNFEYKILPGLAIGKISIEIRPTSVGFLVYGEMLIEFSISGKEVTEGYQQFFDTLWNLSKK